MKRNGSFPAGSNLRRFLPTGNRAVQAPTGGRIEPPTYGVCDAQLPYDRALSNRGVKLEPPTCIICDAKITYDVALRIRHGGVYRYGAELQEVQFIAKPFMDDTLIKWMCVADPDDEENLSCAEEHSIVSEEEELRFEGQLNSLAEGWCCVCRQSIEPMLTVPPSDQDQWSSTLLLELGVFKPKKMPVAPYGENDFVIVPLFHPSRSGHIHYHCIEDFGISLDRLIVVSDAPEWFHEDW